MAKNDTEKTMVKNNNNNSLTKEVKNVGPKIDRINIKAT